MKTIYSPNSIGLQRFKVSLTFAGPEDKNAKSHRVEVINTGLRSFMTGIGL